MNIKNALLKYFFNVTVIGIDISHVTENKPASSTTESSGAHTSGTNTHIHNGEQGY